MRTERRIDWNFRYTCITRVATPFWYEYIHIHAPHVCTYTHLYTQTTHTHTVTHSDTRRSKICIIRVQKEKKKKYIQIYRSSRCSLFKRVPFYSDYHYEKLDTRKKTDHFPGERDKVQRKVLDGATAAPRIAIESEMPRTLVVSSISSTRTRNEQLSRRNKKKIK